MISATQFLDLVATPLVEELKAIEGLKKFTTNTDVIGAHAEAVACGNGASHNATPIVYNRRRAFM